MGRFLTQRYMRGPGINPRLASHLCVYDADCEWFDMVICL